MLIIDGIIFTLQRAGGISVIFRELLDYLDKENIPTTHLIDGSPLQDLPNYQAGVRTISRSARFSERYRSCTMPSYGSKSTFNFGSKLFHSSYYRIPTNKDVTNIVTVHDFMYERFRHGPAKWVHTIQKKAAIDRAQAIICVSKSTLSDLNEFVSVRRDQIVEVIHPGVSEYFYPMNQAVAISEFRERPYILFVGQRGGYKNFNLALATLSELPEFELRCVGGGDFRRNEFDGASQELVSRVRHMGFTSNKELNLLYNQASCLFYPSSYEGFGIPVIEAMKAGCPVVSTNCKAIVEIGGDALQIVPVHDPIELAKAVLNTVSHDRKTIIKKGILNAEKYSWARSNLQILNVYKRLGLFA